MELKEEFIIAEFNSLRTEIQNKILLLDKIDLSGIFGLPAAFAVSSFANFQEFYFFLPIIIIVIVLIYLNAIKSIFRAGNYIKENIEHYFEDHVGWERWLTNVRDSKRVTIEKYRNIFFLILIMSYYFGSVLMMFNCFLKNEGIKIQFLVVSPYIFLGLAIIYIILFKFPSGKAVLKEIQKENQTTN